ncbi:MAG: prepilin-type N-terminal cleavage/methylation domain-containing protein [Phycisphaeraceae bacterium]|nr:MAG: prepilin-type N-terminal cleavage/methylation domain-containing protein [Phycisphaeraceae bacterium]
MTTPRQPHLNRPSRVLRRRRACGFTLIETALALVIIGVGVLAFVDAQKTFIRNNSWSSHAATGAYLANEVRELMRGLPRHDPVTGLYMHDDGNGAVLVGWGRESGEVVVTDFDDIDDFDGVVFGNGGNFPGPLNAFGEIIPRIDAEGLPVMGPDDEPMSLEGWSQRVYVEKVDPANFGTPRADGYQEAPNGNFAGRTVDAYPLKVTVIVEYQGPLDAWPQEVTRAQWVVPPR